MCPQVRPLQKARAGVCSGREGARRGWAGAWKGLCITEGGEREREQKFAMKMYIVQAR